MYQNLHELLMCSSSTRSYFMGLPVEAQMEAHRQNDFLHTAEQLRRYMDCITDRQSRFF